MPDPSRNPYVGARPFEREDRPYFFGRDEEARQLTSLVIAHRVVLFYAPSGAGKTSLLKARVIADLEERRRVRVLPVSRAGGDLPRDLDGGQVANIYVLNTLVNLAGTDARPAELAGLTLAEGLRPYLVQTPDEERPHPRLLILDQFEELFTTHPDRLGDRADFFLQLQASLEAYPHLSLLITMREDYIANLDFYAAQVPDRLRTRFRMALLSPEGALAAVKEPAREAGCPFADGVAETLVDNLRRVQPGRRSEEGEARPAVLGDYVEPVHLQIVCWRLWEKLPTERTQIGPDDVRAFGDVDQALMDLYESALREVFKKIPIGQRRLRTWFETQLITPARTRGVVYRGPVATEGLSNAAVDILYDLYIIRPAPRGGELWYELAHDRLVEPILEANKLWQEGRERLAAEPGVFPGVTEPAPVSGNPFVGPRPYAPGERVYGRARELAGLLDLLITERTVLFYSPQGAGKTSLINAGLIPALQAERFRVLGPLRVATEPPADLGQQGEALRSNRYVLGSLLCLEEGLPPEQQTPMLELARTSLAEYLAQHPPEQGAYDGDVLIFDQFEEFLTVDPAEGGSKTAFFEQLKQVMNDPCRRLLIAMREESIAGLDPYIASPPGKLEPRFHLEPYRLEPLGPSAALEVIRSSARSAGKEFTESAANRLVDDLRRMQIQRSDGTTAAALGPSIEPVQLQMVCWRLWADLAADDPVIDVDDLETLSDVDTALRDYYADTVAGAAAKTGVQESAIRKWIERRLIDPSGIRIRVVLGQETTGGLANAAIRQLVDARLLRDDQRRGATWFELANDRLIDPVRADNAAWFVANLSTLQRQAALWEEQRRPAGLLLAGDALAEAERGAEAHADEMEPYEQQFLAACRIARDEAERERRHNRTARLLAVVAGVIAVVAIGAAIVAYSSRQDAYQAKETAVAEATRASDARGIAEAEATRANAASTQAWDEQLKANAAGTAQAQALLAQARAVNTLEANLVMLLTAQAPPTGSPTPTMTSAPSAAPSGTPSVSAIVPGSPSPALAPAPTGAATPTSTTAPSPTPNRTVIAQQAQLAQVRGTQTALAVGAPTGRIIFVSNRDGATNKLYRIDAAGGGVMQLTKGEGFSPSHSADFLGLSRQIAYASFDTGTGRVGIFEVDRGGRGGGIGTPINVGDREAWEPSFSPTAPGTTEPFGVAFVSKTGFVKWGNQDIYRANRDGSGLQRLTTDAAKDYYPAWSPKDEFIAFVSGPDNQPDIYRMKVDGSEQRQLTRNRSADTHPAWSPDGQQIAFATNRDGQYEIYVMDREGGSQHNITKSPLDDEDFPAWSPDGQWLAFSRGRAPRREVFAIHLNTGVTINITNNPADDWNPSWIP